MAAAFDEGPRKSVPKWNSFADAIKSGEMLALNSSQVVANSENTAFRDRVREFHESRSLFHATDLISCAVVLGLETEVKFAAEFILETADENMNSARTLARNILNGGTTSDLTFASLVHNKGNADRVRILRKVLEQNKRNAFLWCDLALNYESMGNHAKAEKALKIARTLAPDDRFILRSTTKFYHSNLRFDEAHRIIKRSPATKHDPWLMATEIALADEMGKTSQLFKIGRSILDDSSFSNFHIAELASAVGTFEFYHDSISKAKKHLELSLESPVENSIAQAAWIVTKNRFGLKNWAGKFTSRSIEAKVLDLHFVGDWPHSLSAANEWANQEPYFIKPQLMSASIYTMLRDSKKAIDCISSLISTHSNNPILLNIAALNYARLGEFELSQKALSMASRLSAMPEYQKYVFIATNGYLNMKKGTMLLKTTPNLNKTLVDMVDSGRKDYERAIRGFESINNDVLVRLARIYYALVESEIDSEIAPKMRSDVINKYQDCEVSEIKELLNQLRCFEHR